MPTGKGGPMIPLLILALCWAGVFTWEFWKLARAVKRERAQWARLSGLLRRLPQPANEAAADVDYAAATEALAAALSDGSDLLRVSHRLLALLYQHNIEVTIGAPEEPWVDVAPPIAVTIWRRGVDGGRDGAPARGPSFAAAAAEAVVKARGRVGQPALKIRIGRVSVQTAQTEPPAGNSDAN